jgi:predicted nucleic-acid-binding protein
MIGVDTNVLLGLFLRDEEQRARAERSIERATRESALDFDAFSLIP